MVLLIVRVLNSFASNFETSMNLSLTLPLLHLLFYTKYLVFMQNLSGKIQTCPTLTLVVNPPIDPNTNPAEVGRIIEVIM